MESEQLQRAIEAILFAAGERIDIGRLAAALETDASDVEKAADDLEEAGRLNVPGRPIQYKTTPDFLRTFGLSSLEELPPIEKITFGEPVEMPEQPPAGEEA